LPGSWNCKVPPAVLTRYLVRGGPRYDPAELAAILDALPETEHPADQHQHNGHAATQNRQTSNGCDIVERARRYVGKMPAAIEGQGGDRATFAVALVLVRGFALDASSAWPILLDYNARCQPEWSEDDLRRKLDFALEKSRLPQGYLLERRSDGAGASRGVASSWPESLDQPKDERGPQQEIHLTDLGNARRVVARHGYDLRHCHPWKSWHVWDGSRWAQDQTAEAVRRVKETLGALYKEIAEKVKRFGDVGDDVERKAQLAKLMAVLSHALKWEDARAIGRCLDLARSEPGVPVLPLEFDAQPFLLNVQNGTLDLKTGKLRPHRREDVLTKSCPVAYDPEALCPLWEEVLVRIMDDNLDMVRYLQRVVGYGLTGNVSEQCLWFCHGAGANGKSTFLLTLLELLGDYAMQAVSELLLVKNHESHPTERADLFGKRFVATIETEQGKRLVESLMKQLTGGDKVRARKMRQDFFEFSPTHKLFLAANHKPVVQGTDNAVWRRIKLVPFTVTIPEAERDKDLPQKLRAELPGILAWAVRGCLDWQAQGLDEPREVTDATRAYQAEQDCVQGFLDAVCVIHREAKIRTSALHESYVQWSGDKLTTSRAFGDRLREKGYESKKGHGGSYC
jgi:putative DNA primase/helicase